MSLFLTLMLQFAAAAAAGQPLSLFTARVGHDFTLPCGNVIEGHCNGTTWLYSNIKTVALFEHGRIHNEAEDKSDRLSLTANCSLVIKEVKVEDAGHYTCRQFNKSGQQQGSDLQVDLPVMDMDEQKSNDEVILSCSVQTRELCRYTLKWLYKGEENASSHMTMSSGSCLATVTITTSDLRQQPNLYELMTCKVTDDDGEKVQLFPFSPQSTGGKTGEGATTGRMTTKSVTARPTTPKSTSTGRNKGTINTSVNNNNPPKRQGWSWWYVAGPAGSAALLIIVVAIVRWKKTKGNRRIEENSEVNLEPAVTQSTPGSSQEDVADPEDGVTYISISYTKKSESKAEGRVREAADDEGDAVTYSTVKASSSSPDPENLYATVNKANKLGAV